MYRGGLRSVHLVFWRMGGDTSIKHYREDFVSVDAPPPQAYCESLSKRYFK